MRDIIIYYFLCKENDTCPAAEPLALTDRHQRSYIAISVEAKTDLVTVTRTLKRVFKRNAYSDRRIRSLYKEFKDRSRLSTETCPRSGRPCTSTDENHADILNELMAQRTWTIDELVDVMGISHGSVYLLLKRGNYRKVGSIWLPHQLSEQDVELRIAARKNLQWFGRNPRMLGRIIAIDETYVRSYSPLDRQQAREWRLPGEEPYVFSLILIQIYFLSFLDLHK
jgi:transposase